VVDLEAGDRLYLPRGYLHSTTTSDSFSAHVTIGVTVYTWVDLAKEFLATAVEDEELRHALPVGFANQSDLKPQLRDKMLASLDGMRVRINAEKLIDTFTTRIRAAHLRGYPQVPDPVGATLRDTDQRRSFRGKDLPDLLDAEGKVGFLRHLVDIGFLTVVRATNL